MEKKMVLIADDESNIRSLVSRMLADHYTVLTAADGREAVEIAQREKPDLILMDIMMPKMDGYTACSALKNDETTKGIPVVMLTGIGFELNRKLAMDIGAAGYISKPFNLADLLLAIKQHLGPDQP